MFLSFPCSCHVQSKYININRASGIECLLSTGNDSFGERSYCLNLFACISFQDNVVLVMTGEKKKKRYLPCFIPALDLVVPVWKVIPPYVGNP